MFNKNRINLYIIFGVFFISRIIFLFKGISFDFRPLFEAAQVVDPFLLRDNLIETIFYLPSQPPLFNLFLGVILKIFPVGFPFIFQIIFMLTGIVFLCALYHLMVRLGINHWIALILTLCFMISPCVILLENWLMYTYFSACTLTLAALFLHRYLNSQKFIDGIVFFGLLAVLTLLVSIFHLFWFLAVILLIMAYQREKWRRVLTVCCIPLAIVLFVYVKSLCMYGGFTLSKTWIGDQMLNLTFKDIPDEEVKKLYFENKISIYSTTSRWSDKEVEEHDLLKVFNGPLENIPKTNIAVLDQLHKPITGDVSWHNYARVVISNYQVKDSLYALINYPKSYLKSIKRSYFVYFFPAPTDVTFVNRRYIQDYENIYNFMFAHLNNINQGKLYSEHLKVWYNFEKIKWDVVSVFLIAVVMFIYLFLVFFGLIRLIQSHRGSDRDLSFNGTLAFILFNIIFLTVIMNTFGWFANNRYRFALDPFYLTLFALALSHGLQKLKGDAKNND